MNVTLDEAKAAAKTLFNCRDDDIRKWLGGVEMQSIFLDQLDKIQEYKTPKPCDTDTFLVSLYNSGKSGGDFSARVYLWMGGQYDEATKGLILPEVD